MIQATGGQFKVVTYDHDVDTELSFWRAKKFVDLLMEQTCMQKEVSDLLPVLKTFFSVSLTLRQNKVKRFYKENIFFVSLIFEPKHSVRQA
jgi:hypothetical protein